MRERKRAARGNGAEIYRQRQRAAVSVSELPAEEDDVIAVSEDGDEIAEPDDMDVVAADSDDEYDASAHDDDGDEDEPGKPSYAEMERQFKELQAERAQERSQSRKREDDSAQDAIVMQRTVIETAIGTAQATIKGLKKDYAEALKSGEHDKAADLQEQIADTRYDLRRFDEAKVELEQQAKAPKREAQQPAKRQPSGDAYVDSIANLSKPTQDWLLAHREDIEGNPARGAEAQAGHWSAIAKGLKPDSPEYFAHVDKHMGFEVTPKKQARQPGKKQVDAPAGRSSTTRGGKAQVTLSKAELDIAKRLGMDPRKYAANKLKLEKNGQDPESNGPVFTRQQLVRTGQVH